MKVALYLENRNLNTVDCSRPEKGNPGIGGTHYNIITLPYYFQKLLPDSGIKPVLLANSTDHLPDRLESRKAENINEAARICEDEKFDILIWRPTQSAEDISFSREIDRYSFSVVNWVFNTPTDLFYLRRLASLRYQLSSLTLWGRAAVGRFGRYRRGSVISMLAWS